MSINDGGPFHPTQEFNQDGTPATLQPGASLRDVLAMRAPISLNDAMLAAGMSTSGMGYCLQSINCGNGGRLLHEHARLAYQWADAMLEASAAKPAPAAESVNQQLLDALKDAVKLLRTHCEPSSLGGERFDLTDCRDMAPIFKAIAAAEGKA